MVAIVAVSVLSAGDDWKIQKGDDKCTVVSKLSYIIMTNRLLGVSLIKTMGATESPVGKLIVKDAYSRPKFTMEPYIENAKVEFANEWMLKCLEANK